MLIWDKGGIQVYTLIGGAWLETACSKWMFQKKVQDSLALDMAGKG
jgi:hypothetical protein